MWWRRYVMSSVELVCEALRNAASLPLVTRRQAVDIRIVVGGMTMALLFQLFSFMCLLMTDIEGKCARVT